ncbi:hypothetical protein [Anaerocellum danielii]|nr:hypothetical protein [Caldicellulosiruptor danielii]
MEVPIMDLDNTNQLPNIYSNIKMINHQYIIIFVENSEQNGFRFILTDMVNEKYYVYEPRNCCGDYLLYTFSFMDYIPPVNNNDGYILIKTGKIEPHEKEMLWNNHNIERIVDALETFILYPQSKFIQDIILQKPYFDSYLVDCSLRNSSFDFYNFIDEQYYFYTKYKFDKNKTELIKINLHNLTKQDCYVLDGIVYPLLRDREGNFCVFQCLEEQENDKRKLKIVNHSVFKNEKHTVDIDISNDEQLLFAYNFSLVFENFISGFVLTASPKIDFINPKHYKIKIYSTKTKKPVYEFNTKHPVFLHCAYGLINDPLNPEEHLLLLF